MLAAMAALSPKSLYWLTQSTGSHFSRHSETCISPFGTATLQLCILQCCMSYGLL